ncbi:MAG: hypothetical protein MZV49_11685 [Rhodopseudomonas palustris]|nr:hypothetical protein [Rhodopseudomonas palustris]
MLAGARRPMSGCIATAEQITAGQPEIVRSELRLSRPLFGFAAGSVRDVFWLIAPAAPSQP